MGLGVGDFAMRHFLGSPPLTLVCSPAKGGGNF